MLLQLWSMESNPKKDDIFVSQNAQNVINEAQPK